MKTGMPILSAGVASLLLCLIMAGCARATQAENRAEGQSAAASSNPTNAEPVAVGAPKSGAASATADDAIGLEVPEIPTDEPPAAPEPVLPPERPEPAPGAHVISVPEGLNLSPAAQELVKLARAAVPDSVMLAFVTNSTRTFNLGADQIVYLHDLGVSSEVIRAMIEQDRRLRELGGQLPSLGDTAATAAAQSAAPATAPAPEISASAPQFVAPVTNAPTEAAPETAAAPTATTNVTYQYFYDTLSPYGTWVYVDGYGYCWQPSVVILQPGWRPYCHGGRWIYTDHGWYWHSDYTWGWATFHYGRWFLHPRWGWCWWPDTVWAPAWVTWRYHPGYCGWAPLPPYGSFTGFGFVYSSYGFGWSWFTFVSWSHFHDRHPHRYRVRDDDCKRLVHESRPVKDGLVRERDRIVNRGIDPEQVRERTGREVRPLRIRPEPVEGAQPTSLIAARERWEPARGEVVAPRLRTSGPAVARVPGISRPERPPAPPAAVATAPTAEAAPGREPALRPGPLPQTEPGGGLRAAQPIVRTHRAESRSASVETRPAPPVRAPELAAQSGPELAPALVEHPSLTQSFGTGPVARGAETPNRAGERGSGTLPARPIRSEPRSQATHTWTQPSTPVPQRPTAAAPQPAPAIQSRPAPAPAAPTPPAAPPAPTAQRQQQNNVIVIRPSTPPGFNSPAPHPSGGVGAESSARYRVFSTPARPEERSAPAPAPVRPALPQPAPAPPAVQRPAPPPVQVAPAPVPTAPIPAPAAPAPSVRPAPAAPAPPSAPPAGSGRGGSAPGRSRDAH